MIADAYDRVFHGRPMPGLLVVPVDLGIGAVVDELVMVLELGTPEDFAQQVLYLPLR